MPERFSDQTICSFGFTVTLQSKTHWKKCRQNYLLKIKAACTIQTFFTNVVIKRRLEAEKLIEHSAAVKIQAIYRCWSKQQDYLLFRLANVCIQRRFRARLLGQASRMEFENTKKYVVIIQRNWRNFTFRSEGKIFIVELKKQIRLAEEQILLEKIRTNKMEQGRRENAAILLQRNVQKYLKDNNLNKDALVIQKYTRKYLAQKKFQALNREVSSVPRTA